MFDCRGFLFPVIFIKKGDFQNYKVFYKLHKYWPNKLTATKVHLLPSLLTLNIISRLTIFYSLFLWIGFILTQHCEANATGNYLFIVKNGNTRTLYEICSKLTINILERYWRRSGVFTVNLEQNSHVCYAVSIVDFE